jgi:hypothetical protein
MEREQKQAEGQDLHDSRYRGVVPKGKEEENPDQGEGEQKSQGRSVLRDSEWLLGTSRGLVGRLAKGRSGNQGGIRVDLTLPGVAEIPTPFRFLKGLLEDGGSVFIVRGIEQALNIGVRTAGKELVEDLIQVNGPAISGVFPGRRRHFACGASRCIALLKRLALALALAPLHFMSIIVVVSPGGRHTEMLSVFGRMFETLEFL